MSNVPNDTSSEKSTYRRRTVMGGLAAGAGLRTLGSEASGQAQTEQIDDGEWPPANARGGHVAVLSGYQADVETDASGCVHVMHHPARGQGEPPGSARGQGEPPGSARGQGEPPGSARGQGRPPEGLEDTLIFGLVLEDIECVTQAHIHEGSRDEEGPVVAPLLEYTEELDGTGDGDPLTTDPETPLIEWGVVEDADLVENILDDPSGYYVNVHTVHNPGGEIRGQIRGFNFGQETEIEPEPAEFTVSRLDPQDVEVVRGDRIDVSARIRNVGDVTESQTVEFRVDDVAVAEREIELACRSSRTVTFEDIDTEDLDPDEYEHGIFTEDDSETAMLTVLRPAEFVVSNLDPQDVTVAQGDIIDVSATIENVGDVTGTQTVEFRVNDDPLIEQELELGGEESETVTFEDIDTEDLDPDEYEHGIFTEDDSETATLTVQSPPEFVVSDLDPQDVTVTQGDLIDVSATIENVDEASGTQTVEFRVDDTPVVEQELELDSGESETVIFEEIDTAVLEPGEYEHGIFTEDDSETALLTVEPAEEDGEEEVEDEEDEERNGEDEDGAGDEEDEDETSDGEEDDDTTDDETADDDTADNETTDDTGVGDENGTDL